MPEGGAGLSEAEEKMLQNLLARQKAAEQQALSTPAAAAAAVPAGAAATASKGTVRWGTELRDALVVRFFAVCNSAKQLWQKAVQG